MNIPAIKAFLRNQKFVFFQSVIACKYSRFSFLLVAKDVSPGGTSATQRQKFHTNDIKSVWNLVRSSDWSTYQVYCFNDCLQMTDKRQKATKFKCKRDESITKQSVFLEYILLSKFFFRVLLELFRKGSQNFTIIDQEKHKIKQIYIENLTTTGFIM